MALSIKDEATDRLVRRYAALRKTSYTGAIKRAVSDALQREEGAEEAKTARIRAIQARVASYARDPRTDDEILGYDENGVPR